MTGAITSALGRAGRAYVVGFPRGRGKRVVIHAARRFLPAEALEFDTQLPGGGMIRLRWDEAIGREILRRGEFEAAEIEVARRLAKPGTCVFDVGANVGMLTIPLGLAVGPEGMVVAVEPLSENAGRLRANVERNGLSNVREFECAAAAEDGRAVFNVAEDPAFGGLAKLTKRAKTGEILVPVRSLDSIWRELGNPIVSLLKIDVEGAELDVVRGATAVIAAHAPALLVEADDPEHANPLIEHLEGLDYSDHTPPGVTMNRVFLRR